MWLLGCRSLARRHTLGSPHRRLQHACEIGGQQPRKLQTQRDQPGGVLHEGQLDTRMTVDVRKPNVKVALSGGLKGVELNSLLTSMGKSDTAAGYVDMDWDVDTQGTTALDLQTGLDGDLNVQGRNVEITSASAQELVCTAIAQIQQTALTNDMPPTTKLSALTASIRFEDGQAKLAPLDMGNHRPGHQRSGRSESRDS